MNRDPSHNLHSFTQSTEHCCIEQMYVEALRAALFAVCSFFLSVFVLSTAGTIRYGIKLSLFIELLDAELFKTSSSKRRRCTILEQGWDREE